MDDTATELAIRRRTTAGDCFLLAALVGLSVALYTGGLGFYSDDWAFLRILETTEPRSFSGLVHGLNDADVIIRQRPVQAIYLAGLYSVFGLDPLGYHIINALALIATVVLFYLLLRELNQPRRLALAVAVLYGLMPNYSSDRFWIAAHQTTLSVLFLMVSALAALYSLRAGTRNAAVLAVVSVAALAASGLAYEVALPLFALVLGLFAFRARRMGFLSRPTVAGRAVLLLGAEVATFAAIVAFKADRSVRVGVAESYLDYIRDLVGGTLRVDLGVYGLGLPYVLSWIVSHAADAAVLTLGTLVAVVVAAYLYRGDFSELENARTLGVRYVGAGLVAMALGYAIFVVPTAVSFSSASLGNRIRIAAALGVAALLVGALVLAISLLESALHRRAVFAAGVGLLCGAFFIVTNTLARFWVSAYQEQGQIVADIQESLPRLSPGSAVIVDGVCLERGGAYVFTGHRDVRGVLTIRYGQESLRASAITKRPSLLAHGLSIHTFGRPDFFRYGEQLIIYNVARHRAYRLVSRESAERYFRFSQFQPERDCPPGFAWRGKGPPS